jgi:ubiquinone/menaquinone biosynthesis C-methylase UbiE
MLPRTLEPEVMDTAQEAADYDAMDHSQVNRIFVDDLLAFLDSTNREQAARTEPTTTLVILDVGTGTALIPIELARRGRPVHITAIDLAQEMLKVGRRNVAAADLGDVISLELVDAKSLPYGDATFDVVMSNSIVHHIPKPGGILAEMTRVLRPGGLLFVRDLARPESAEAVESIVRTYAGSENARQQQLFRQSLHAALTVGEVAFLLESISDLTGQVQQTSDRHWTIAGIRS